MARVLSLFGFGIGILILIKNRTFSWVAIGRFFPQELTRHTHMQYCNCAVNFTHAHWSRVVSKQHFYLGRPRKMENDFDRENMSRQKSECTRRM